MTDYGLVSIITPNYNCARFISETIESVQAQTYLNWELLIQDDHSSDESIAIAKRYAEKDNRIKVECNSQNAGAAVTRNNAIRRSQGKWLAFLDSDDLWDSDKLKKQLKFMVENDCDFSFTSYEHITEYGEPMGLVANTVKRLTYRGMMLHCWPGCLTVMARQDLNKKVYAGDVKKNNDTALFLRMMKASGKPAMGMPEVLAKYRIRKGSISRSKLKILKPFVKVIHEFEGQDILFAYFCVFTHMFVKTFFKYKKIS